MTSLEQKWESLTLADDFMFGKIMSEPGLCSEMLRRIFPDIDTDGIKIIETQKTIRHALHVRGVRFDILTNTARSIFDIEAQKRRLKDLHKRARAYHIAVGYDALSKRSLKKSGTYENLPDTYVVFICTFDAFNKGRHIYTFRNFCAEDKEIGLDDGASTIFLNTEGKLNDVSPELRNFLKFMGKGKMSEDDAFIKILNEKVKEAKHNAIWRDEYMLLITREDEKFAEGRAEGRNEGRSEGIHEEKKRIVLDMLKDSYPLRAISKISQLSEDVIRSMAGNFGLNVVS